MIASVTREARQRAAVKEDLPALRRVGERRLVSFEVIPIVRSTRRHDGTFEGRNRPYDIVARDGDRRITEGSGEELPVERIFLDGPKPSVPTVEPQLDRVVATH